MSEVLSCGTVPATAIQSGEISISAKDLGVVAMPDFCQRCFWVKLRLKQRKSELPFQIFPGIFSSIDSYTKNIVHGWFDKYHSAPRWMQKLEPIKDCVRKLPTYREYKFFNNEHGIWLRGSPDGVLIRPDNSYIIVDYKTAKYTEAQDRLYPMYATQLNVYALIGMQTGIFPTVNALALIYTEPLSSEEYASNDMNHTDDGFRMGFAANIHHVDLDIGMISGLLGKVREIHDMGVPPKGRSGCKDCESVNQLIGLV